MSHDCCHHISPWVFVGIIAFAFYCLGCLELETLFWPILLPYWWARYHIKKWRTK